MIGYLLLICSVELNTVQTAIYFPKYFRILDKIRAPFVRLSGRKARYESG